eukprot:1092801-Rhodomonas_salina.1
MLLPPGLEHLFTPGKVLRLKRQVYGLSQSGRVFYKLLAATMHHAIGTPFQNRRPRRVLEWGSNRVAQCETSVGHAVHC